MKKKDFVIVANLAAGGGNAKKILKRTAKYLHQHDIAYQIHYTPLEGAQKIVKKLIDHQQTKDKYLLIIGGDGTLNQAVNGVQQSCAPQTAIAYLPAGSGNDFARCIQLSPHQEQQFLDHLIHTDKPTTINIGKMNHEQDSPQFFVNYFGLGFDAAVVHYANQSPTKQYFNKVHLNKLIYLVHIFKALKQPSFSVTITLNGQKTTYDNIFLCIVGNEPYFGGGIKILPDAKLQQKDLEVAVAKTPSFKQLMQLIFQVFITGTHLSNPLVYHTHTNAQAVTIDSPQKRFGHVDGEELGQQEFSLTINCAQQQFWF